MQRYSVTFDASNVEPARSRNKSVAINWITCTTSDVRNYRKVKVISENDSNLGADDAIIMEMGRK